MTSSAPTLPHPSLISSLNHIPPPPIQEYISKFRNLLTEGTSIPSSWGTTRFYDFSPKFPSSARRVIMLHGGGTPAVTFTSLARELTKSGNHVVTYDLWGHGLSSTPLETHTPAIMHTQLLELLAYLRWSSAHIIGFSIGGSIAATFTAIHPCMVESLTLISPAGLLRKADRGWWERLSMDGYFGFEWLRRRKVMFFINGGRDPQPKQGWEERVKNGEMDGVAVEAWQRENHGGHVASLVSMLNYAGVYDQHANFKLLGEQDVRALVLVGSEDGVFPEEMLRRELGGVGWKGEIKVVEGAGHGIVGSHFEDAGKLLDEFWS
ncbi:alpha/beta-hydrolase [Cadophora sp. DSE1049]|nr:alpha/beta-hydrolase [Cadophora sp. DSE1049]